MASIQSQYLNQMKGSVMRKQKPPEGKDCCEPSGRKKGKKVFVLERRCISPVSNSLIERLTSRLRLWHVFGKYSTDRDRERAMETMQKKGYSTNRKWEYRTKDEG